jgi:hypothetical protein
VQRAILAGDVHTGITIMQMERGLDTGPMLATVATPVAGKTAGDLTTELATLGADLMIRVLADLPSFAPEVQPEAGVTYAAKIDKAESRLDFSQSAEQVERQVRAFAPAPGAFFELEGERYRVLAAAVADGSGTPGTVLDDALTIACGQGALRPSPSSAPGARRWTPPPCCAAAPFRPARCWPDAALRPTLEFDGGPFMGLQRQSHGPSVQQSVEEAAQSVVGHARRCTPPGAPTPAFMRWACARISTWNARSIHSACPKRSTRG